MKFHIINIATDTVVETVESDEKQAAINGSVQTLANEYGFDTPTEFANAYPLVARSLMAITLH